MTAINKTKLFALLTCSLGVTLASCDDDGDRIDGSSAGKSGSTTGGSSSGGSAAEAGSGDQSSGGTSLAGQPPTGGSAGSSGAGSAGDAGAGDGEGGSAGGPGGAGGSGGDAGDSGMGEAGEAGGGGDDSGPHQDPILKYAFDETSGTTAHDGSGRGHDATLSAEGWSASGRHGGALALTSPKYVTVPPGVLKTATETTITAWLKLSANNMWNRVFDFGGQGAGTDTRFMYLTPSTPAGMRFSIFGGDENREATVTTGTGLPLNVWKHVAVTAAASGEHRIYIDGFPAAEASTPIVPPSELEPLSESSWIGKSRFPDPGYEGSIDDFLVYDRVLEPSEIAALASPGADYSRLGFDEGSGSTSADASTRGVGATLEGGVTWSSGQLGAAAVLSGSAQYVTLNNPLAGCTDQLTIALWVKHTMAGNWARIFDFGGTTDNFMYLTPSTDLGKLRFSIHNSSKETTIISDNTVPTDGQWHHVAVVVTSSVATVFIDGAPVGNAPDPITPSALGATNEHWLGKSRFPDPYFNGAFDELRISCRAYNSDEIKNLAFK